MWLGRQVLAASLSSGSDWEWAKVQSSGERREAEPKSEQQAFVLLGQWRPTVHLISDKTQDGDQGGVSASGLSWTNTGKGGACSTPFSRTSGWRCFLALPMGVPRRTGSERIQHGHLTPVSSLLCAQLSANNEIGYMATWL